MAVLDKSVFRVLDCIGKKPGERYLGVVQPAGEGDDGGVGGGARGGGTRGSGYWDMVRTLVPPVVWVRAASLPGFTVFFSDFALFRDFPDFQ